MGWARIHGILLSVRCTGLDIGNAYRSPKVCRLYLIIQIMLCHPHQQSEFIAQYHRLHYSHICRFLCSGDRTGQVVQGGMNPRNMGIDLDGHTLPVSPK